MSVIFRRIRHQFVGNFFGHCIDSVCKNSTIFSLSAGTKRNKNFNKLSAIFEVDETKKNGCIFFFTSKFFRWIKYCGEFGNKMNATKKINGNGRKIFGTR